MTSGFPPERVLLWLVATVFFLYVHRRGMKKRNKGRKDD